MIDTTRELYLKAVDRWGQDAQLRMVQEECAELIVAINKWSRAMKGSGDFITEEVADVEIMCGQMRAIFGDRDIDGVKAQKLERLRRRLAQP